MTRNEKIEILIDATLKFCTRQLIEMGLPEFANTEGLKIQRDALREYYTKLDDSAFDVLTEPLMERLRAGAHIEELIPGLEGFVFEYAKTNSGSVTGSGNHKLN